MAGNITIISPKENYIKVPKGVVFSDEVDPLSLGLYVKVLALGRTWKLNVPGLAKTLGISADRVRKSLSVLEGTGYVVRHPVRGDRGRFTGWDYEVYSEPSTDEAKNRNTESSAVGENRNTENPDGINKDYNINRDLKDINKDYNKHPAPADVAAYVRTKGFKDPEGFAAYYVEFNDNRDWIGGNGKPIVNWKNNLLNNWMKFKDHTFADSQNKDYIPRHDFFKK